jgi:predicted SnoaL-like aldol condensation-catalyzing enzyme
MSEENKKIVLDFYQKSLNEGNVDAAFQLYGGKYYRQHNPLVEDGQDALNKFVAWIGKNHPGAHGDIKRVFAEGDYVVLHSHWHGLFGGATGEAVVDIFRVEDGKVVEHWDVIQPVPDKSANSNTMF